MTDLADHLSIHPLLRGWAERTPDAIAFATPGRAPLSYSRLYAQIGRVVDALNELGVGREDRIALVLPQGPEMAAMFLAVSAGAISAPLNSSAHANEFDFLLSTLNPKALIVQSRIDSPARAVARLRGIPLIEVSPIPGGAAGEFTLSGDRLSGLSTGGFGGPDDFALMLLTSGTTSRPKIVPLTHRNICAAADNTRAALGLTGRDRCLNAMPLFHGHGLIAGVMASMMAGASVVCTPAFGGSKFFWWMDEFRPTWYTAVPTIHKAVLAEAPRHREIIARTPLRFIRSASAPLPLPLMAELEEVFGVPVTESYGLSEALQLTNTPLDPHKRKVGSLGMPGTSEVAIINEVGEFLGPGEPGEIVCRGPILMAGYFNNAAAHERCFIKGWFRTGDLGFLDGDGHLHMTGRLKELINRGGEKVLPQEVDEALMHHPAIAQATTFGIPDAALGEDVAAAVVLRPGMSATPAEIRQFAVTRLAEFKVPRRVLIVASIPAGPTGKLLRRELAGQLGLATSERAAGPSRVVRPAVKSEDPLEDQLTQIWEELLDVRPIAVTDDFFDLGGNSLLAVRMMEEIDKGCGRTLHSSVLFSAATVQHLARLLREEPDADPARRPLIEVQRGGTRRPFFFLNGDHNGGGFYCRTLARCLDPQQPFYALSPHGIEGDGAPSTIAAMAEAHLDTLRSAQPVGPYLLGGFSHAGLIAFEMARRLEARGEAVALLVVLDMPVPDPRLRFLRAAIAGLGRLRGLGLAEQSEAFLTWRYRILRLGELWREGSRSLIAFGVGKITGHARPRETGTLTPAPSATGPVDDERLRRIARAYRRIVQLYIPGRYAGRVTLISSLEGPASQSSDPTLGWRKVAADVNVVSVPGNHETCIIKHVDILAKRLQACLDEARA